MAKPGYILQKILIQADMKILAIEKGIKEVKWDSSIDILEQEAQHVFRLYLSDTLREIYFTEDQEAVLVLETENKEAAKILLDSLPLVKAGKIRYDLLDLRPYMGYERLIRK